MSCVINTSCSQDATEVLISYILLFHLYKDCYKADYITGDFKVFRSYIHQHHTGNCVCCFPKVLEDKDSTCRKYLVFEVVVSGILVSYEFL